MELTRFPGGVIAGLMLVTMLVVIGVFVGQSLVRTEREAYERGVRMVVMHARCLGGVPSADYVGRAFAWGDPKTCEEVLKIERSRTSAN